MSFKATMEDLMNTNIISEENVALLKRESVNLICDPAIIINLRHQKVKRMRKERQQAASTLHLISEAKRLILKEEFEKIAKQKELEAVDREIYRFKKQLETNKNNFKLQMKTMVWPDVLPYRDVKPSHIHNNSIVVPEKANIQSQPNTNSDTKLEMIICFKNKFNGSDSTRTGNMNTPEYIEPKHTVDRFSSNQENNRNYEHIHRKESENTVIKKQNLMMWAWKKWIKYVHKQKIGNLYVNTDVDKTIKVESQQITDIIKYWNHWKDFVKETKSSKTADEEKKRRELKIDTFLKLLEQRKHVINSENRSTGLINHSKSAIRINEKNHLKRITLNELHMRRSKNLGNISELGAGLPVIANVQSSSFHHRFEAQQQIIAQQKAKLEEQGRLIEELKLAHILKETDISTKEVNKELNETLLCCDSKLKGKAKNVKIALSVTQDKEAKKSKLSYTHPSCLLTKMEERAKERGKRWNELKEIKRKREEERIKKLHSEEEERRKEEEDEKQKRLQEINEKRYHQKEIEIQKKKERLRMSNLMCRAVEHHKIYLLKKYGILPLKRLLILRQNQLALAQEYCNRRMLSWHFHAWSHYTCSLLVQKIEIADYCCNAQLLRKGLHRFFTVWNEYVMKQQVACDYWELKLQQRVFVLWSSYTCRIHLERNMQLQKAAMYHNRKLLVKVVQSWKCLPALVHFEREKERRKRIWRQKVQEMLPDFRPGLTLEETC